DTLEIPATSRRDKRDFVVDFGIGYTETESFPLAEWNRTLYRSVREWTEKNRQEAFAASGYLPLRSAIAHYLRRARGIEADAEDVAIVNGSTQAITLLVQLLLNPDETVVMEDPGYSGMRHAVETVGAHLHAAPIDAQGIRVEDWDARLLFITPSRQFPTGSVLSLERRQELLRWAARRNAIIIEDDYDSEFRYKGRPIEPLKTLDRNGRVVYIGTFSKTMFTDIRIGYVVLPAWLREPFSKARHLFEPHPTSLIQQRALADFMNSGTYERHLRRMKRLYSQKHKRCVDELQSRCSDWFDVVDTDAGLHLYAWWKQDPKRFDPFLQACKEQGIWLPNASHYQSANKSKPAALFGFAHLQEEQICWAFETMEKLLRG
ncbi:MAG: MocR-like pyridoxine biosynthesis transcription factor PdxR, partial [Tumebacillaceae bacterium]